MGLKWKRGRVAIGKMARGDKGRQGAEPIPCHTWIPGYAPCVLQPPESQRSTARQSAAGCSPAGCVSASAPAAVGVTSTPPAPGQFGVALLPASTAAALPALYNGITEWAGLEKGAQRSSSSNCCCALVATHWVRLSRASSVALNTSRDGVPTLLWAAESGPQCPLCEKFPQYLT